MASLLDRYSAFAIDLDGVVWRGDQLLEGAAGAMAAIRRAGKRLLFVSNNAAYAPDWVVARLTGSGIPTAPSEVLTSGMVLAGWIRDHGLAGQGAFVLGSSEVAMQLGTVVKVTPIEEGRQASMVIVARDIAFDYRRLKVAADAVRGGATLITTNRDPTLPLPTGLEPGTGAIVAAIEAASGGRAIVIGKPEAAMMEAAARILGRDGVLMVGDRVDSDIRGARLIGWDAALVLTGVTGPEDPLDPKPDYVMGRLADIAGDYQPGY